MIKKNKKQIIISFSLTLLLLAFLSFSYYLINVNNETNEKVVTNASTMSVTYTDCAESTSDCANINKNLKPGESVTKTFRVENTGTANSGFEIIFKSLTNSFVDNELVYEIFDEFDNIIVPEKPVPYGTSEGTTIFADNVAKNKTKSYKMVVTFKELDKDQEANKTASYNIELGIKSSLTVVAQSTFTKLQSLNSDIKINSVTPNFANISPMPSKYKDNGITGNETSWTVTNNEYYLTYGDDYIFNETTGKYTLTNPKTCKVKDCYQGLVNKYYSHNAVYVNSSLHNDSNMQVIYKITNNTTNSKIYYKASSKNVVEYDDKDSGLFETEDNYGQSLYFRGNVNNNYVKFGKNKTGQDMYWRIIRINGDGTLRLLYDGTSVHENGEVSLDRTIGNVQFNSTNQPYDAGYVGYMYGNFAVPEGCACTSYDSAGGCIKTCTSGGSTSYEEAHENVKSSTIKTYLENWYEENIKNTNYSTFISDQIFCNDRTKKDNHLGYGLNTTYFVYYRLRTNKNPKLTCENKNDSFTSSDAIRGNAKLTYPIGLITADEISFAGNVYGGDYNYMSYIYKGYPYWAMSADSLWSNGFAYASISSSILNGTVVNNTSTRAVPVINLTTDAVQSLKGKGTMTEPFEIE